MIWCPSQQTSSTASQAFLHRHTLCSNAERRVLPLLAGCSGLQCLLCPLCAPIIGRYQYMLSTVYSLDCQCIPGSDNLNLSRKYHQLTLRASLKKFSSSFGQRGRMMQAKTGVKHASLYSEHTRQDQLGPKGVESMFENRQGLKLATYFWPAHDPNNTQAVILGVHGHGAHLQNEYLKRQVSPQHRSGLISRATADRFAAEGQLHCLA